LENLEISNWDQYNDFCDYIENDKPSISELNKPYILTEHYKIKIDSRFDFVFDDVMNYIVNPDVIQPKHVEPIIIEEEPVKIEFPQWQHSSTITVSNITFKIY